MNWKDVVKEHKKTHPIYTINGEVVSVVFSNDPRRKRVNEEKDNKLLLHLTPDTWGIYIEYMKKAQKDKKKIKVFYKLSPDNWTNKGYYIVSSIYNGKDVKDRESIIFVLSPT